MTSKKSSKTIKRAQASIKKSARQSTKTAEKRARQAKSAGREILRAAKKNTRAALKLSRTDAREAAAKGRALKKLGIYNTRLALNQKTITKRRAQIIEKKFREIMRHGIPEHGKTIRPLMRTMKGYELTGNFKFVKSRNKPKRAGNGIIPTRKGVILETHDRKARIVRVDKDGSVVTREERFGKMREVFTGVMSQSQQLRFIRSVEDGTFQIPDDFLITVSVFGNDRKPITTIEELQAYFKKHRKEIESGSSAGRPTINLEYVKLTARETAQNRRGKRHA